MNYSSDNLNSRPRVDHHDRIIWIILVTIAWYLIICEIPLFFVDLSRPPLSTLFDHMTYMPDGMRFVIDMYLLTIFSFVGALLYTAIPRRNRFIYRSFLPSFPENTVGKLMMGLLVGFVMNFGCIVCAMVNGDIKLFLNFAAYQIPFYLFALVCVFIQSSSEELWCRGFMYERINVHYPLWVAILVNGLFFAALHLMNPGVSFLPILDIAVCGLSFSIARWYTGSIWFVMGIHTGWNFTQNLIFGLPNSGLVSEASIWGLDAASARDSLVYNVGFGVEGAIPAVLADALLGVICLILAARSGRLGELKQKQVTKVQRDVLVKPRKDDAEQWVYKEKQ